MRWTAEFTWQESFNKAPQSEALIQPDTEMAQTAVLVKEEMQRAGILTLEGEH